MTTMHPVEITDRHHGAGQRTAIDALSTAACNMELPCRHRRAHRVSGRLQEIAVMDLRMFSIWRAFGTRLRLARR
jgi:hypothetical protein